MTSLVNASAVGFDLVRLSGGAHAARVLEVALGLTEGDLEGFAAGYDDGPVAVAPPHAVTGDAEAHDGEHLPLALRRTAALVGEGRAAEALTLLEAVPVLGPAPVLELVRGDLLGWARALPLPRLPAGLRAVAMVCDAVICCWADDVDAPVVRHVLAHGSADAAPEAWELGPGTREVTRLLEAVRTLDRAAAEELLERAGAARPAGWAEAMHGATWAAHVTGRLRISARAQLRTVGALREAPMTTTELASSGWNCVSGAVLAHVVADVLDDDALALLTGPVDHLC